MEDTYYDAYADTPSGPASAARRDHDELTIEPIMPAYMGKKAQVHSQTWHETYAGVLPQPMLDLVTPEFALNVTKAHDPSTVFIARFGDDVVGYAEFCDTARPPVTYPYTAELAAIYVLRRCQRRGIGSALIEAVRNAVSTPRLVLWVAEGNVDAQQFYAAMGFHATGVQQVEDDGAMRELEFANFDETAELGRHEA